MTRLSFDEIRALLPHDYPLVLVDQVLELEPNERILAVKNVSGNEWMFPGHFPATAVYPGVLLIESLAQAAILLALHSRLDVAANATFFLAGVRSRFLAPVVPGDQVYLSLTADKLVSTGGVMSGEAAVGQQPVAKATLTFAIRVPENPENGGPP